jgi:hypothetical protein
MKHFILTLTVFVCLLLSGGLFGQESRSARNQPPAPADELTMAFSSRSDPSTVVPRLIKFNGTLRELTGKPLAGPVDVTFSLYSDESGGSPLWFETQTVQANALGHYTVLLGAMTPAGVPMELFTAGEARWLGVQVSNLPEQPRVLLVSVPYAMKAGDAETLGGRPASAFMLASQAEALTSGAVGAGTLSGLVQSRTLGSTRRNATTQAISTSGTANYIAGWSADGTTLGTTAIFQDPTTDAIGIGTATPAAPLDLNGNAFIIGTATAKPGFGGTMRFRDDTGTPRWLFGLPGSSGATKFRISDLSTNREVFAIESGAPVGALYVNSAGNVGIGTAAPTFALDINANVIGVGTKTAKSGFGGSLRFRDDTGTPRWLFGLLGTSGATTFNVSDMINHYQPFIVQAGAPTNSFVLTPTGVGIGTAAPAHKLDVAGDINATGGVTAASFTGNGSGLTNIFSTSTVITGSTATFTGDVSTSTNLDLPATNGTGSAGVITLNSEPFIQANGTHNTFVGRYAGNFGGTGTDNTAVGNSVLYYNSGSYNTGHGSWALASNSSGSYNTASGYQVLYSNTTAEGNTASGDRALYSNTVGAYNVGIGSQALYYNVSGSRNIAIGQAALYENCSGVSSGCAGNYNIAIGYLAGETTDDINANLTGANNTFLGAYSGPGTSTQLSNATAIGANAVVSASNALVLGSINGVNGATSSVNVGIGTATPAHTLDVVGDINATGSVTVAGDINATGAITGNTNNQLVSTVAQGTAPLQVTSTTLVPNLNADLLDGNHASAFQPAGSYATLGSNNFNGNEHIITGSLTVPTTINFNAGGIYVYNESLSRYPYIHNCCSFTAGNIFVGAQAGRSLDVTAHDDVAVGYQALYTYSNIENTAVGSQALYSNDNTTGNRNSGVGHMALYQNTSGYGNAALGNRAGYANTTGHYNTFVGEFADASSSDLVNATAIGHGAIVGASNSLVLGSINGVNVGIGTTTPTTRFQVAGGDLSAATAGKGLIVKSPDGTKCARIGIDNDGKLVAPPVACP